MVSSLCIVGYRIVSMTIKDGRHLKTSGYTDPEFQSSGSARVNSLVHFSNVHLGKKTLRHLVDDI